MIKPLLALQRDLLSLRNLFGPELLLVVLLVLLAFLVPGFGRRMFAWLEARIRRLSGRPATAILVAALAPIVIRLLMLPIMPVPQPSIHDEFSHLLAADTFAHGRLTNAAPLCWEHFESFHITVTPLHISMEPPLKGMVMAAGQVVFHSPWAGVMLEIALMSACCTWMLYGWVPPYWAFVGGLIVALRFGVFSYWMNSYWGGALAAAGGALVLGALPRLLRRPSAPTAVALGFGAVILANTRPFEGMTVCLAVAGAFTVALARGRLGARALVRQILLPMLLVVAPAMGLNLYYNQRTTGTALRMAHQDNRERYALVPYWVWQAIKPPPPYNHELMREFYTDFEAGNLALKTGTLWGFLRYQAIDKLEGFALFFFTPALLVPILVLLCTVPFRTLWAPVAVFAALYAGMLASSAGFLAHYAAPVTSLVIALSMMGLRRVRVWRRCHGGTGLSLSRWLPASIGVMCIFQACIAVRPQLMPHPLGTTWGSESGGSGFRRADTLRQLGKVKSLVFVRYAPHHWVHDEWVYNEGNIQEATVILARDMGEDLNRCVIEAYPSRKVWLLQPDLLSPKFVPYPVR
jgi:hypothetical protein